MVRAKRPLRLGIDTGGTFTDAVALDGDRARVLKIPSTPDDPGAAVLTAADSLRGGRSVDIVHGSTVGLNALLQRRTARTALVVPEGFRDLVEIGRQVRPDLYALEPSRAEFPVGRRDRFTLAVRRDAQGRVLQPLDDREVVELAERLQRAGLSSVALCLLHAPTSSVDERRIARIFRRHSLDVSCSHEVLPRLGEFERAVATCQNAALRPLVGRYLERLSTGLGDGRLRLLRNTGGIVSAEESTRFPVRTLFSGLAGGLSAASRLGAALGYERLATFDMGGTSTDVALVRAAQLDPAVAPLEVAGLPFAVPALDLQTIGCGGGSIARQDEGGALRVGPESAGADPGPACYGRSEAATVTDAHVALGHLGPETLRDSGLSLDPERSLRAIQTLATRLGCSARRCAEGILDVADVSMARALGRISSGRSVDPAGVSLLAFGGAGPLHAARLAERSGFARALIPPAPGVFSAVGLALAAEGLEVEIPIGRTLDPDDGFRGLEPWRNAAQGRAKAAGRSLRGLQLQLLCRFRGQGQGIRVPWTKRSAAVFEDEHRRLYGFSCTRPVEAVSVLVRHSDRPHAWPSFETPAEQRSTTDPRRPPVGGPPVRRLARTALNQRSRGQLGPLLIEETTSVTWVPAGFTASETEGVLVLERRPG